MTNTRTEKHYYAPVETKPKTKTTQELFETTFLRHVPEFLSAGHNWNEAVKLASAKEEAFLTEMINRRTKRARKVTEVLATELYNRFNK